MNTCCRWTLTKSTCFPKIDACAPFLSLNMVPLAESSWICTSVKGMMGCAGFVLTAAGVKDSKELFLLKVQNGSGENTVFQTHIQLLYWTVWAR